MYEWRLTPLSSLLEELLSILSLVNKRYEAEKTSDDDQQQCYDAIVDSLAQEERDRYLAERGIALELELEHGVTNVTPEMYEAAFAAAGLE